MLARSFRTERNTDVVIIRIVSGFGPARATESLTTGQSAFFLWNNVWLSVILVLHIFSLALFQVIVLIRSFTIFAEFLAFISSYPVNSIVDSSIEHGVSVIW